MKRFERYVDSIESLAQAALTGHLPGDDEQVEAILNGQVADRLRKAVGLKTRRRLGAFFTSTALRHRVFGIARQLTASDTPVVDITCGAGDLLLGCAELLPVTRDLSATLTHWGRMIHGFDTQPVFVRAARARLALAAVARVGDGRKSAAKQLPQLDRLFPGIQVGDGLARVDAISGARTAIINPPFGRVRASNKCAWASGQVSSAAVFLARCIESNLVDNRVIAILPDVLRTGSRYARWRSHIMAKSSVEAIEIYGRFSKDVDVDVFILALRCSGASVAGDPDWWKLGARVLPGRKTVVQDRFAVSVGPIVPHRDPKKGPRLPYIFAKVLPPWDAYSSFSEFRRFAGRIFMPPFVAVRRTSSPQDSVRAVGTVVLGKDAVGVENHILVLKPIDGLESTCWELLDVLRAPHTQEWLNQRIRCRHLTVATLRDLPWTTR